MNELAIYTALYIVCTVAIVAAVGFIYNEVRKSRKTFADWVHTINTVRNDYMNGIHSLPKVITDAAEKDTHLTLENARLKEMVTALELVLKDEIENYTGIITDLRVEFTKALDTVSELTTAAADAADLRHDLASANQELASLKEAGTGAVAAGSVDTTLDLREAVEAILEALDTPKNVYEAGVYNGVVSVANTFFEEAAYELAAIPKTTKVVSAAKEHHSVRGADGRFVKRA
jgi:uncharacterized protein YukE